LVQSFCIHITCPNQHEGSRERKKEETKREKNREREIRKERKLRRKEKGKERKNRLLYTSPLSVDSR
jgi:hypothetical protein